jgi:histidinol-phosphatase (PHP family)
MTDGHIHIERGPYTLDWIRRFTDRAAEMGLDEIGLLEHSFRFEEFVPMYDSVRAGSAYVEAWFNRQTRCRLGDYLDLIGKARNESFPVAVRFGLEICYFREHEDLIAELTRDRGFDFLLGSIHYVDGFAFDLGAEYWEGMDTDRVFRRYFEDSVSLAESGLFGGIGHPDHIGLFGHRPSFPLEEPYERLARALSRSGMYADENSGAARRWPGTARLGMDPELIRALKRNRVRIVTSSDAHRPEDVGYRIREMTRLVADCPGD